MMPTGDSSSSSSEWMNKNVDVMATLSEIE
jgi:hypothetical protein